jgi:hypothetical protein
MQQTSGKNILDEFEFHTDSEDELDSCIIVE